MAKVFISYRREDSEWQAHEIYTAILRTSGANKADVFIDVDSVPLGVNFKDYIDATVAEADVLLALIGRHWLRILETPRPVHNGCTTPMTSFELRSPQR